MAQSLLLILGLLGAFSAQADDYPHKHLRFTNSRNTIVVEECTNSQCRHIVDLTPQMILRIRSDISAMRPESVPLLERDGELVKQMEQKAKVYGVATGAGLGLLTLMFNPVFYFGAWVYGYTPHLAHVVVAAHVLAGAMLGYLAGRSEGANVACGTPKQRKESLLRFYDRWVINLYSQIPEGSSQSVEVPRWLIEQIDRRPSLNLWAR